MGVHVHLAVAKDSVDAGAWQQIFADARRVVDRWTPAPLSIAWRQIGGERVGQYSLDVVHPDGLHIIGDRESLTTGEAFVFPMQLARPRQGATMPQLSDVLVAVARRHAPRGDLPSVGYMELFGDKTQGLPYHSLIVALGLLVEHRLPSHATVFGDLSLRDGEIARRRLAETLAEDVAMPVVLDAERLRQRLSAVLADDELADAVRSLGPPNAHFEAIAGDLLLAMRKRSPESQIRHELEHVAPSCRDPAILHVGTRLLFARLVGAIHSNIVRAELRARVEEWGHSGTCEAIARGTVSGGFRLTEPAWNAIEAADLEELTFVVGAICTADMGFEIHHAVRGLLENPRLRDL